MTYDHSALLFSSLQPLYFNVRLMNAFVKIRKTNKKESINLACYYWGRTVFHMTQQVINIFI